MFNSLMPSLNIRSLPFVVFMGGFPSRLQNLSSGAIRPGGLLFNSCPCLRPPRLGLYQCPRPPFFDVLRHTPTSWYILSTRVKLQFKGASHCIIAQINLGKHS